MHESLPSRGAWIEIAWWAAARARTAVAPLAGSVDRNVDDVSIHPRLLASLPSRGAWIEIPYLILQAGRTDRRSPRGERG